MASSGLLPRKDYYHLLQRQALQGDNVGITKWEDLTVYKDEKAFNQQCKALGIRVIKAEDRKTIKRVSLGLQWDVATGPLVDVGLLLNQNQI